MGSDTADAPVSGVARYLRRLRRRAGVLYVGRAVVAAGGAAALTFAMAALLSGPVAGWAWVVIAWLLVGAAALSALWYSLRSARVLLGWRIASLLGPSYGGLASAARSAVELGADPEASRLSPDLVQAHARRVEAALRTIPPQQVVSLAELRHPSFGLGIGAVAAAALLLFGTERADAGAYALLHPGQEGPEGAALAHIVEGTSVRLTYPAYMHRSPTTLEDPAGIDAPRGTSIRLSVRPHIDSESAVLRVADRDVRLERDGSAFVGNVVAREGGPIHIRMKTPEGRWLADAASRWLHLVPDRAPVLAMTRPDTDRTIELEEPVIITYEADDDFGLKKVELVVQTGGGREERRTLAEFRDERMRRETAGTTDLLAAELGARPGDQLTIWIEAQDYDVVSGPNVGKSESRVLAIASEATRRMEDIAHLEQALDLGLAALARRLEWPVEDKARKVANRHERVAAAARQFVGALHALAGEGKPKPGLPVDAEVLTDMAARLEAALRREARAYPKGRAAERAKLDARLVAELEDDALLLADLVGRARLEDAAEIARALEELRREMTSLIAELRRTGSAKARQALRAALARAEARMRELMGRLAEMGQSVPSEFVNADALRQAEEGQKDALASMREALETGDFDSLERNLMDFERRITALAESLGQGEEAFSQARFGPQQRAMAEALDALAGLETEQRQLAERSEALRRTAAERALEASDTLASDKRDQLAERAEGTRKRLDEVDPGALGPMEEEALERARQRLQDSADALRSGDLGEARRMAQEGTRDLERLARDLELSALMFPGHEGKTASTAEAAAGAAKEARELERQLDRALPDLGDYVDPAGQSQLREDATRQTKAQKRTESLAEEFRNGPNDLPLAPDASRRLQEAVDKMKEATKALERRDPLGAAQAQDEAARDLGELRENLENHRRQRGKGGGGGRGSGNQADMNRRVRIPGADEHQGPMELRRQVLDAMREGAPDGYEESVRRYYEGLLR